MEIDVNGVKITLTFTQSQLEEISRQTSRFKSYKDIKTFEDACDVLNINQELLFLVSDNKNEIAYKKLKTIIKALNEGWYPNWENQNERKYYNYFTMRGGFSSYATAYNDTNTSVPSALCLKSNELAEYAAKIAFKEYNEYYK